MSPKELTFSLQITVKMRKGDTEDGVYKYLQYMIEDIKDVKEVK